MAQDGAGRGVRGWMRRVGLLPGRLEGDVADEPLPDPSDRLPSHGSARRLAAVAAAEEAAHPTTITARQQESQARLQVLIESRAVLSAILGGVLGVVAGLVVFPGRHPELAGDQSIQFYASIIGGVAAGAAFLLGYSLNARMANLWLGQRPKVRQLIDTVALLVVHASIAVMGALGIFRVFQEAFVGLRVDFLAGSALLGVVGVVTAYFSFNSGARLNAFSVSSLLGIFMASGVLVSMLYAENPYWWQVMFSELGTGQAGMTSFWTFNTTLVVSGIIITTLTAFITRDLRIWAERTRSRHQQRLRRREEIDRALRGRVGASERLRMAVSRHVHTPRIGAVRIAMIGMGVSLAGVGLVPINFHDQLHSTFTSGFGLFFIGLLVGLPYWLPGFPRATYLMSWLAAGGLIFAISLWKPIGYYNLTSLELIAAGVLFFWLIVFIRTVAAVAEIPGAPGGPGGPPGLVGGLRATPVASAGSGVSPEPPAARS